MDKARRWEGLWLDEFEGSRFCAAPADDCTYHSAGERVWLTFAEEIRATERPAFDGKIRLYQIEFIGRQTSEPGHFGHAGTSDRKIVVEELLKLELVSRN
ncbi:hypothetical protein NAP1_11173 [Erythrobacter sp. NAP1]|nr:hypothetical protein NAP1_11173 [Erythrobacter sp. NAP1]